MDSSFQMSGRLPMHSGYKLSPTSGSQPGMPGHGCGLDLRLPLLPAELKDGANFETHMLGKVGALWWGHFVSFARLSVAFLSRH